LTILIHPESTKWYFVSVSYVSMDATVVFKKVSVLCDVSGCSC